MTSISNEAVDEFDVNATTSEAAKVRNLRLGIFSAVQAVCIFAGGVALADDQSACQQFTWSIARENTAFSAPNLDAAHSGTVERALPERGIALKLDPISSDSFSLPLERKPKRENGF
jgi:hypothetical protein